MRHDVRHWRVKVYFAYFDESGDSGRGPNSPTKQFVLSGVLVNDADWLSALDQCVGFRRYLRISFTFLQERSLRRPGLFTIEVTYGDVD